MITRAERPTQTRKQTFCWNHSPRFRLLKKRCMSDNFEAVQLHDQYYMKTYCWTHFLHALFDGPLFDQVIIKNSTLPVSRHSIHRDKTIKLDERIS